MVVCLLEGNIGAGKTTLCQELGYFVEECIDDKFLGLFYSDPGRYGFALQMVMQTERLTTLRVAIDSDSKNAVRVIDRSVIGDWAFAACNRAIGSLSVEEWLVYQNHAGESPIEALILATSVRKRNVFVVHLEAKPEACLERAQARGGVDANSLSLEYLRTLAAAHLIALASLHNFVHLIRVPWEEYGEGESREALLCDMKDANALCKRGNADRRSLIEDAQLAIAQVENPAAKEFLRELLQSLV